MPTDSQSTEQPNGTNGSQNSTACPNCRAQMPMGMRFCRLCGFRLGEGVEEYTETVRFDGQTPGQAATASGAQAQGAPYGVHDWGAMASPYASQVAQGKKKRKAKGPHWIVWVILSIIIASVAGGSFMFPFKFNIGNGSRGSGSGPQQSVVGAGDLTSVDGGVMIESASPPDGPVDKAGMIGGDIITSFDSQPVKSEDDLRKQIGATPIGKTVEILYIRDGEAKKTTLTTVSEDEVERLNDVAAAKPEGLLGVDDDFERVPVPNTNIYGVKLGKVYRNRPAYTSGLRDGDILIEFNGIPIRTRKELSARIDRTAPDSIVLVKIIRGSERMEIKVTIGIND